VRGGAGTSSQSPRSRVSLLLLLQKKGQLLRDPVVSFWFKLQQTTITPLNPLKHIGNYLYRLLKIIRH
jgi:hypothetical protein